MCYSVSTVRVSYSSNQLVGNSLFLTERPCYRPDDCDPGVAADLDKELGLRFLSAYAASLSSRGCTTSSAKFLLGSTPLRERVREMRSALQWVRTLSPDEANLHDLLQTFSSIAGKSRRQEPLWIGAHNPLDEAAFVFCEPGLIADGLVEIEKLYLERCSRWARRAWLSYVLICGIHPLRDGNGRLGRCLMVLLAYRLCKSWNLACLFSSLCFSRLSPHVEGFALLSAGEQDRLLEQVDGIWSDSCRAAARLLEKSIAIRSTQDPMRTKVINILRLVGNVNSEQFIRESGISGERFSRILNTCFVDPANHDGEYADVGIF